MEQICIRNAEFSDLEKIYTIEHESINSWTLNQFTEELGRNFSRFIVAIVSDIIAGYAVAWYVAGELQLNSIAVSNNFRRQGIGSILLNSLISNEFKNDISKILIEVRKKNTDAIDFYLKNGFMIAGTRKNYYNDDDAILMEKNIS
ncbi:MAG TPA: ribosomal protein S18-alanine N-acetyltransferase [Spirochaetota bacterium]|nr:ribosomal protein S18-alanine N-acetyltransferase [Spirochaetota bacterium]HPJ33599.1 ribosomal protein S18-alanine N-acetyltransferase [Spirochaetota bacterium]